MNDNSQFKAPAFVPAPIPENDDARIEALLDYKTLDTPETETFDDITRMASVLCNTPIATITMVENSGNGSNHILDCLNERILGNILFAPMLLHQQRIFLL